MSDPRAVVIDTNVVLDLLVFDDPASRPLKAELAEGRLRWLATAAMREELQRVLGYPQIARRLLAQGAVETVLHTFDRHATLVAVAPRAPWRCKDPDDQAFIDLAVAHGAALLSKDAAVTSMRKRLEVSGVAVLSAIAFVA